jgi:hypothetical protein
MRTDKGMSLSRKSVYLGLAAGVAVGVVAMVAQFLATSTISMLSGGLSIAIVGIGVSVGGLVGNLLEMKKGQAEDQKKHVFWAAMSSVSLITSAVGFALLLAGTFTAINPGIGIAIWMGLSFAGAIGSALVGKRQLANIAARQPLANSDNIDFAQSPPAIASSIAGQSSLGNSQVLVREAAPVVAEGPAGSPANYSALSS